MAKEFTEYAGEVKPIAAAQQDSPMLRRTCYFSGRVQGVGFRQTAHVVARRHGVSGYVRNLPDGRVELVMEGDAPELQAVLNDLADRMAGFIRKMDQQDSPASGEFAGFSIRH
jgi:acylphosphatase